MLREIDRLESQNHVFHRIRLEKLGDFWLCQFAVDGILRQEFIEPHANVAELDSDEFENYIKAQSLGMPAERR